MPALKRAWSTSFGDNEDGGEASSVNNASVNGGFVDEDDEDEPSFGKQILPVARLPDDFNGEPVDGLQYLFMVRRDAKRLPHVTRVELPEHLRQYPTASSSLVNEAETTGDLTETPGRAFSTSKGKQPLNHVSRLPSEEWRTVFLSRFKNLRKNLRQQTISVDKPAIADPQKKLMPDRKLRDAWWLYIAGRPSREWDPPRSDKARKRAERRATTVARMSSSGVNGGVDGCSGGVKLGVDAIQETQTESQRSSCTLSAYAQDVTSWEVQQSVEKEVLVYDENGEILQSSTTLESVAEVEKQLEPPQETTADEQASNGTLNVVAGFDVTGTNESEKPGPPRQPTPNLLKLMDNTYCVHLLKYFTHWMNLYIEQNATTGLADDPLPPDTTPNPSYPHPTNPTVTETHTRWIFALLSRVDDDVSADDMSQLRMLARACIRLVKLVRGKENNTRSDVEGTDGETDDMSVSVSDGPVEGSMRQAPSMSKSVDPNALYNEGACWIVISAIADFWGQRDLWMDAESILSGS